MWIGGMNLEEAQALKTIAINGFLATVRENYKLLNFTDNVNIEDVIRFSEKQLAVDQCFMELIGDTNERINNLLEKEEEND